MGKPLTSPTPTQVSDDLRAKTATLAEALPYMRMHAGHTFVVKYGGHAMGEEHLALSFARDIVLLKQVGMNPVVVHGGGPQIGKMLDRLKIKSEFVDGLRKTSPEMMEVVEMVLSGSINKQIVSAVNAAGGKAIGLSGKDAGLIRAKRLTRTVKDPDSNIERELDLGLVGEPETVDAKVLDNLARSDFIPVIAPIGMGPSGETFNINADTVAGAVAGALRAKRLLLLTDVVGVLDKARKFIPELSVARTRALIGDGTISGGMIPKVETCVAAVEQGVEGAVIMDGRVPNAVLLELFTPPGFGTRISQSGNA